MNQTIHLRLLFVLRCALALACQTDLLAQAMAPTFIANIFFKTNDPTVRIQFHSSEPYWAYDVFAIGSQSTNVSGQVSTNWINIHRTFLNETNAVIPNTWHAKPVFAFGTLLDSDSDGLTDAFEILVSHTNPQSRDSDGDDILDPDEAGPDELPWFLEQERRTSVVVYASKNKAEEGGRSAGFKIYLPSPAPAGGIKIGYRLGGTAVLNTDFTLSPPPWSILVPSGENSAIITVHATDNREFSDLENYLEMTLTNSPGYRTANLPARVDLVDNDPPEVRVFALPSWIQSPSATYGTNSVLFQFVRDGNAEKSLAAEISVGGTALSGIDYQTLPRTVIFPAGSRTTQLHLNLKCHDTYIEKSVVLTITNTPGYQVDPSNNLATVVIGTSARQPTPVVQVTTVAATATLSKPGRFAFTRSGSTNSELHVVYEVTGMEPMEYVKGGRDYQNYQTLPGWINFMPGDRTVYLPLRLAYPFSKEGLVTVTLQPLFDGAGYSYLPGKYKSASVRIDAR